MTRFLRVRGPPIPSPQFPVPSFQSPCPQSPRPVIRPLSRDRDPRLASCHTYPAYPRLPQPTPQHGRRTLVSSDYIRRADVLGAVLCCDCSLSHPYPYPASASAPPARPPASSRLVSPRLASSRFACSQLFSSVTVFSYARLFSFPIRLVVSKSLRPHHTPLHAFSHIPSPTPFLASFLLASFPPCPPPPNYFWTHPPVPVVRGLFSVRSRIRMVFTIHTRLGGGGGSSELVVSCLLWLL